MIMEPVGKTIIISFMKKLFLILLLCLSPCAVGEGLPDLGDVSQTVLTPLQERQIGQQNMMQIRSNKTFPHDPPT